MDTLNEREIKLFKNLKLRFKDSNSSIVVTPNELSEYSSLLRKMRESKMVNIVFEDNQAIIYDKQKFLQFETDEKNLRKQENKKKFYDYKVAVISSIAGAGVGSLVTWLITYLTK